MPWNGVKSHDGRPIPSIAFGTWKLGNGVGVVNQVVQGAEVGIRHLDTAQAYRNEVEVGQAVQRILRENGLKRDDLFITTKWSALKGLGISESIEQSLENLGVSYVDLYLIHHPRLPVPDAASAWKEMEKVYRKGYARSIGVSNFGVEELNQVVDSAGIRPVILLHPYVYEQQLPILQYARDHDIIIEAYSVLMPLTRYTDGPLDAVLANICENHQREGAEITKDQILLAWTKHKLDDFGGVVVTTSSQRERLEGYMRAGQLCLSKEEIASIDQAGLAGKEQFAPKKQRRLKRGVW
ncbi:hypothetical protein D9758_008617 [Tetrapyrgos nigripes]|uniref:NADP-dependent oxidoreductase domain-containing protein n=1 Tax=Tetrapyrgos nigripes TaxID=182062 RepID=A0A8H5FXU8_9AGAR|nr:hypothetical protein D9758_008617 [Tetrapyrgos nigripes]